MSDPKDAEGSTSTGAAPMFVTSAQEVLHVLADDASHEAVDMRREATELVAFFRTWPIVKPRNDERLTAIQRLMDLTRRSMAHVGTRPHGSKPPSKP